MTWRPVPGGRQHSTPTTLSIAFHEEPGDSVICFLEVDKTCVHVAGILPRFSKICWRVKCWSDENHTGNHPDLAITSGYLFQGTRYTLLQGSIQRYAPVVGTFTPVFAFVCEFDHTVCQSFGTFQGTRPPDTRKLVQELFDSRLWIFHCSLQAFGILTTRTTSAVVMVFLFPKCTYHGFRGARVTEVKRSLQYSRHLPRNALFIAAG